MTATNMCSNFGGKWCSLPTNNLSSGEYSYSYKYNYYKKNTQIKSAERGLIYNNITMAISGVL